MKTQPWAIGLVAFTTLLTSVAQMCYKLGAATLSWDPMSIITNYYLIGGLGIYVISFVLLLISYKGGEASVIYPIFASSYIWVVVLSVYFFNETLNVFKVLGVLVIVLGIAMIARASQKDGIQMEVPA